MRILKAYKRGLTVFEEYWYSNNMEAIERQYRLRRQKKRQRVILLCLIGVFFLALGLYRLVDSTPKYIWLEIPPSFYRPDMVSNDSFSDMEKLQSLPLSKEDSSLRQAIQN